MKIVVLKNNLQEGLSAVGRSIGENLNLPILKNILLKTSSNQLTLSSTNLELAITSSISGKVLEEGLLSIPFDVLFNIVNNLTNERVHLESKGFNLILKTDNYEALLQGVDPQDFPIIPKIKNTKEFIEINSTLFKESITRVVNAAQISELRPEISGVLIDISPSALKFAATDSFRLAERVLTSQQFKTTISQSIKVIIPLRTIQEMVRVVKEDISVQVFIDSNQALFKVDGLEVVSRLIEGAFPDYNPIIPQITETEFIVQREQFINAVKLTSSFANRVNELTLKVEGGEKVIKLYSSDTNLGENNYLIPSKVKGSDVVVIFNWRYLLDGLKNIPTNEVLFGLNGDSRPAVLKAPEDTSYLYILMPVKPT